jgi:hypothetical protein
MLKKECGALKKVDNNYWYHDQDQEAFLVYTVLKKVYDHDLQRFWRFP